MSRNQSINNITSRIALSSVSDTGDKERVKSFASYYSNSEEGSRDKDSDSTAGGSKPNAPDPDAEALPELFTLTDPPDFSGLFELCVAPHESRLTVIIKSLRKNRGITAMMPVSQSRKLGDKERASYLLPTHHYITAKGKQYSGRL